jgi:hypothetical protein
MGATNAAGIDNLCRVISFLVVSKPHTQWEDSANSTNLNLIQENSPIQRTSPFLCIVKIKLS